MSYKYASFEDLMGFLVGDTFVEEGYDVLHCVVESVPLVTSDVIFDKERRQLEWKARITDGDRENEVVDYLVTEGLEHYGPTILIKR